MLILDLLLLSAVLTLAAWRLFAPAWRPKLKITAIGLTGSLAIAQWARCGFTWQHLPAYFLLALAMWPPIRTGPWLRRGGYLVTIMAAAASVGVWLIPAVPTLPRPDGRYAVGTETYRWTDVSRDEPHTADPADRRSVIAQVWYPASHREPTGAIAHAPYIDGIGRLPPTISGVPRFILSRYDQIDIHADTRAGLASDDRPWPVVILSPGYGAPRAAYTGLATQLASRGFVVFALDHPYESAVTELPDGRVVGTREILLPGESNHLGYMVREQTRRTADIRFVIRQLARPEALSPQLRGGRLESSKVAVIGHSFGGAAAVAALSENPRVVAAANIDGTPYGDLPDRQLSRPFLLLQSDNAETRHSSFFVDGNSKLLTTSRAPAFQYEIKGSNHFSFTDAPFYLASPGRWLLARVMGGERGPAETQRITADLLAAFLSQPLTGRPADLAATAHRFPSVLGGAVNLRHGIPVLRQTHR